MSQFAREHPELAVEGVDWFDYHAGLADMPVGPKRSCPHCHLRSCWLGLNQCEAAAGQKKAES